MLRGSHSANQLDGLKFFTLFRMTVCDGGGRGDCWHGPWAALGSSVMHRVCWAGRAGALRYGRDGVLPRTLFFGVPPPTLSLYQSLVLCVCIDVSRTLSLGSPFDFSLSHTHTLSLTHPRPHPACLALRSLGPLKAPGLLSCPYPQALGGQVIILHAPVFFTACWSACRNARVRFSLSFSLSLFLPFSLSLPPSLSLLPAKLCR